VVARLRVESDLRRGAPYRWGHPEGVHWAREVASWAEICRWAMSYEESDVHVVMAEGVRDGWSGPYLDFVGKFRPPEDYDDAPSYIDEEGVSVGDPRKCEQRWRGWLAGVKEVFEMVKTELEPIPPYPELPPPPDPGVGVRDVDPDDIPF
jgi:hypothetical protein